MSEETFLRLWDVGNLLFWALCYYGLRQVNKKLKKELEQAKTDDSDTEEVKKISDGQNVVLVAALIVIGMFFWSLQDGLRAIFVY